MRKIFLYILILIALMPAISFAQYQLLEPLPCVEGTGNTCENGAVREMNLNTYIQYVFKFSIALAAGLAVIMIIWGGFQWMLSEVPFIKTSGKQKIWDAIIGLVMILASYLILATIDPRLVEINTSIKPITVNPTGIVSFQDALLKDLESLSADKQLEVIDQQNKLAAIDKERVSLKGQLDRKEITKEKYDLESVKLNIEETQIKASQSKTIASGIGLINFRQAYTQIYNSQGTDQEILNSYTAETISNNSVNGKLPTNSPNKIQNDYNKVINEIKDIDPEGARILGLQRNFYIEQVKEEIELHDKIITHGEKKSTGGQGYYEVNNSEYLKSKLQEYKDNLEDPRSQPASGLSKDEYEKIMKTRIDAINKKLSEGKQ